MKTLLQALIVYSATIVTVQSICTGLNKTTCRSRVYIRAGLLCRRTALACTPMINAATVGESYDCYDASNTVQKSFLNQGDDDDETAVTNTNGSIEICMKTMKYGYTCHGMLNLVSSLKNVILMNEKLQGQLYSITCTCKMLLIAYRNQSLLCQERNQTLQDATADADQWPLLVFYGQIALLELILIGGLVNTFISNTGLVGFQSE